MHSKDKPPKINLKSLLYTKGRNSSVNNLVKILHSKRLFFKIAWSLVFMLLLAICSYTIIVAYLKYLAYDIVTLIRERTEMPAKLPAITVCNANGLTTSAGIMWASNVYAKYNISKKNNYIGAQPSLYNLLNSKGNIVLPKVMAMTAALNPQINDTFRKSLGLSMKDMLISCTFNAAECTADDFVWFYENNYGNCFRFNATRHTQISCAGKLNGLNMELFVGQPVTVEQVAPTNGLHIFIANETVKINSFDDGVNAAANKETNIYVEKKRITKIRKPYGQCTPDLNSIDAYPSANYLTTFQIYDLYRQKDCFNTCFQKHLINVLGCYSASSPYLKNTTTPACLQGLQLYNSLLEFTLFFIRDVGEKCSDCPLECESEYYTLTTSSLDYPTAIYAKMLANQTVIVRRFKNAAPTYDQLRKSIALVNINYKQLVYTQIKEVESMTATDLVTKIGGNLSLTLGICFLSFYELIELFVDVVYLCADKISIQFFAN